MLIYSLGAFTVVAVIGLIMTSDVFRKKRTSGIWRFLHVAFVLIGAVLAFIAAVSGDARVWINVTLAVIIIGLGCLIGLRRAKGENPGGLVLIHGGIAVVCYLLLAYFALFSHLAA